MNDPLEGVKQLVKALESLTATCAGLIENQKLLRKMNEELEHRIDILEATPQRRGD